MPSPSSLSPTSVTTMEFPPKRSRPNLKPTIPSGPTHRPEKSYDEDDIAAEFAKLESLRMDVKQNLSLRPLASPALNADTLSLNSAGSRDSPPPTAIRRNFRGLPPPLALKSNSTGSNGLTDSSGDTTSTDTTSPASPSSMSDPSSPIMYSVVDRHSLDIPPSLESPSEIIAHYASPESDSPKAPISPAPAPSSAAPMSPPSIVKSLEQQSRPLLLDTRPTGSYLVERINGSINLAIPTLILKRWKKYVDKDSSGQQALSQAIGDSVKGLKGFVTTEEGKEEWDMLFADGPGQQSAWNGDIVVYDDEMDEMDPLAPTQVHGRQSILQPPSSTSPTTSWLLISILSTLPSGHVYWLRGGFSAARRDPSLFGHGQLIRAEEADASAGGGALSLPRSEMAIESPGMEAVYGSSPTQDSPISQSDTLPSTFASAATAVPSTSTAATSYQSATSDPITLGNATGPGAVGGGLFSLRTDTASSSRFKSRPQIEVPPTAPATIHGSSTAAKAAGVAKGDSAGGPQGLVSGPGSHGFGVAQLGEAQPRRPLNHTRSMLSLSTSPRYTSKSSPPTQHSPAGSTVPYSYSVLYDTSPSPSPSTTTANLPFPRTPTATSSVRIRSNTGMLPKLARLDTKSRDRLVPPINTNLGTGSSSSKSIPPPLPPIPSSESNTQQQTSNDNPTGMPPKLSLRTTPFKSATLAAPIASPKVGGFGLKLNLPPSPSRPAWNVTSPQETPLSGSSTFFTPVQTPSDLAAQYPFTPLGSSYQTSRDAFQYTSFAYPPRSPAMPTTPLTARPPPSPNSTSAITSESESAVPPFVISTILPGFLYLGPELSSHENVEELQGYNVKRILNMAIECEPEDYGLDLARNFDRYLKIPMRDTVEEDRVARALKEVCEYLDDARLHSSPVYVHCKAGKSRSVTAVMAYLIHANHWPLSRAYSYVIDRRRGVSPNIGFVSELMTFEELKLGKKSVGVVPEIAPMGGGPAGGPQGANRRNWHARDSLPPMFPHSASVEESMTQIGVPVTAGGGGGAAVGAGAGEEMEIKDNDGRYRHARRAPVNEQTLQPLRRVSKAGLESSWV